LDAGRRPGAARRVGHKLARSVARKERFPAVRNDILASLCRLDGLPCVFYTFLANFAFHPKVRPDPDVKGTEAEKLSEKFFKNFSNKP
jgi:hypothetical protein